MNKHDHLRDGRQLDEDYGLRAFDIPAAHAVAARILRQQGSR